MELMKRKVKACSVLGITMSSLFIFAGIVTALNYSEYNGDFYTDISKCMHRGLGLLIMCVGISFLVYFILENVKNDIVEEKETVEHLENNIVNREEQEVSNFMQNGSSLSEEQMEELKQYKELVNQGIITENEFQQKKTQIMGL